MTFSGHHIALPPSDGTFRSAFVLSGAPGATTRHVQLIGTRPLPGAAALFPGLSLDPNDREARLAALTHAGSHHSAVRLSRRGRPVLRLRPGILQTPRFVASPPWLSATVVGGARNGRTMPGAAEQALAAGIDPVVARRGAALADQIVGARIGGACWADAPAGLSGTGFVVVQGSADPSVTARMLDTVVASRDAGRVLLLLREPAADLESQAESLGCRVLAGPVDPWALLDMCAELHVADGAPIGFLALLAGRPVHCHAAAWLAGWGLTQDAPGVAARTARRSLTELAAAALLSSVNYADPFTGNRLEPEAATAMAADWRRIGDANRTVGSMTGMQFWKRRRIAEFLHTGLRAPDYFRSGTAAVAAAAKNGGRVAAWSSRMPPDLKAAAQQASVPVVRVEDGFIRSVGLGSNFLPPCSIILDERGIYYDPGQPSDLEHLLATATFDAALVARAERLIERLVREKITKYNVGKGVAVGAPEAATLAFPSGRNRVLVPGQVADDLSVRLGGAGIAGNAELLRRVRAANPDAYIVYKPHPDVDAGHRPGAIADADALGLADEIVRDVSMAALIEAIDEVHTLTSLAGFEALLRGRRVVTWGQPFYAGWGLTHDMAPIARRQRTLTMPQLAACVLLLYPRYVDPVTGMPCPVETLMDRLADERHWRPGLLARLRQFQGAGLKHARASWRATRRMMTSRRQT